MDDNNDDTAQALSTDDDDYYQIARDELKCNKAEAKLNDNKI